MIKKKRKTHTWAPHSICVDCSYSRISLITVCLYTCRVRFTACALGVFLIPIEIFSRACVPATTLYIRPDHTTRRE